MARPLSILIEEMKIRVTINAVMKMDIIEEIRQQNVRIRIFEDI